MSSTPADYAAMVEANGGKRPPFAKKFCRYSFFCNPGELGEGGTSVAPVAGEHGLPRTTDQETAAEAALGWLRSVDPPYDRAMVSLSGHHPIWLRADGTRWQLPDDADLEVWGTCS